MRAFVALDLPADVRASLATLQQELTSARADVKWVAREQLHITLKFLDEISEPQRIQVEALLRGVARELSPFLAQLHGVGAFPSMTSPKILWVGVGPGREPIARLAEAIEEGAQQLSLRREERSFSAHVTLGRVRSSRGQEELVSRLREISWQAPPQWRVESVQLYQSVLSPGGPQHSVLADLPLRGESIDHRP